MDREKDSLRNWMIFSRSEKYGITLLLFLLIILITIRVIQKHRNTYQYDVESVFVGSSGNNQDLFSLHNKNSEQVYSSKISGKYTHIGVVFDPNKATMQELRDQGIPTHISARIIKYREKGGVFYQPADLYKIYGIDSLLVEELLDWMVIETISNRSNTYPAQKESAPYLQQNEKLEINTADSSLLCNLQGIGPVLSRRIIRYRNLLGGYYTIEQLNEVYGISDSLLTTLYDQLTVDTSILRTLAINTATFNELKLHPYLSAYEAKAILSYRRLIGQFTTCDELVKYYILSDNTYRKVRSYLSLN